MAEIEASVEVDVDVRTAHNQWTQFESFPRFMSDVQSAKQLDERHVHWIAEVGGRTREWDAEIVTQIPDERIAWRSLAGTPNDGEVSFQPLSGLDEPPLTRVTLKMIYDPNDWVAAEGDLELGPPPLVLGLQLGDLAQQALHDPVLLDAIQDVRVEFRVLVHRLVDDALLTAEMLLERLPVGAGDRQGRRRGARGSVGVRVAPGTGTTFSFVLPT